MSMDLSCFMLKRTKIKIGNGELTFAELNLEDLALFKAELVADRKTKNEERRARLISDAKKIGGDIDALEILRITDTVMSQAEFESECETTEGLCALAYYSLRHAQPDVSRDDAKKVVPISQLEEITEAMFPGSKDEAKKKPDEPEASSLAK